jgi:hypothetical protein
MKPTNPLSKYRIALFGILFSFFLMQHTQSVNAQSFQYELKAARTQFESLTDNQRIDVITEWNNNSAKVPFPKDVQHEIAQFVFDHKLSQHLFDKGINILRIIFNEAIPKAERVIACDMLEKIEDAAYFPMEIVEAKRNQLIQQ